MAKLSLEDTLALEETGPGLYRAQNMSSDELGPHGRPAFIVGGQMLGQAIVAAHAADPGKRVKSIQAIYARSGRPALPLDIAVEVMHTGRSVSSVTVTFRQPERLVCRALVLLDAGERDVLRYAVDQPSRPGPDAAQDLLVGTMASLESASDSEVRLIGDPDLLFSGDTPGPAELSVWVRWRVRSQDQTVHQALSAFYTNMFLIGAAMRPHQGVGYAGAHQTLSTGPLSHTIVYHEPVDAGQWSLLNVHAVHAGAGRSFGYGDLVSHDGTLVASFAQVNMIREMPAGSVL
jgi:acyl-CoA thioesterase II